MYKSLKVEPYLNCQCSIAQEFAEVISTYRQLRTVSSRSCVVGTLPGSATFSLSVFPIHKSFLGELVQYKGPIWDSETRDHIPNWQGDEKNMA